MTKLGVYLSMLICIVANCNEDSEWLKCKPKPGCSIARCDPRPSRWFGNIGEPDDYSILCQKNEIVSSDNSASEHLREIAKLEGRLERAENEADEMKLQIKDLEEKDLKLQSQIKAEREKRRGLEDTMKENFTRWKNSAKSEMSEMKVDMQEQIEGEFTRWKTFANSQMEGMKSDMKSKMDEFESLLVSSVLPVRCEDIERRTDGVAKIQRGGKIYDVYCDMSTDGGNWTVFQRRMDGSVDFYRTWEEYASGFGNKSGEFWLGLEAIYQLTQGGSYELRVDLTDWDGSTRFALYRTFSISGRSDGYRLTVGRNSGTAGDSMNYHNGQRFSAKDKDFDSAGSWAGNNCATYFHASWWFNNCATSSLNGRYNDTSESASGVFWHHWRGSQYSLKGSEMKFRKK